MSKILTISVWLQPAKRRDLERLESEEGLTLDISDTLDMFTEEPPVNTGPVSGPDLFLLTKFFFLVYR